MSSRAQCIWFTIQNMASSLKMVTIFYLPVPVSHPYGIYYKIAINKVTITTDLIGLVLCWHLRTSGCAFQKILKLLWQCTLLWKHVSGTGHAAWPGWVNLHKTPTLALSQEREKGREESSQGWKAEMSVLKSAPAFHSPPHPQPLMLRRKNRNTENTWSQTEHTFQRRAAKDIYDCKHAKKPPSSSGLQVKEGGGNTERYREADTSCRQEKRQAEDQRRPQRNEQRPWGTCPPHHMCVRQRVGRAQDGKARAVISAIQ